MTVPVLWVSRHDDILARGYADQAMLEAIFDRSLWSSPNALEYEHIELVGIEAEHFASKVRGQGFDGAVVVLPSRHHVDDVDWFVAQLDELDWSVVLLTSEEEWLFDWRKVYDPADAPENRRLWVWQPRPEHENVNATMPCGWYPGTREALATAGDKARERPLDWFLGCQVTHVRRTEAVEAAIHRTKQPGLLIQTQGFMQGVPFDEYVRHHAEAKVSPCPSGPESLCTARVEESLEAGSVPLLDIVKPKEPQFDYWYLVFGPGYPMPTLHAWRTMSYRIGEIVADWPRLATRCSAFWQQWKRKRARQLDEHVRAVSGIPSEPSGPDDLITVIIPTSPVPANPDITHIIDTIDSVRERLPLAEVIVVADGVRPEQDDQRQAYEEALNGLVWACNWRWRNVVPVILDDFGHQANATRAALELVTTPLVLFVEHDTPLVGESDWPGLCAFAMSGEANAIRFHFDVAIHADHEAGMLDHEDRWWWGGPKINGSIDRGSWGGPSDAPGGEFADDGQPIAVRRTKTWWQRPHLARTDFYRDRIMPLFTEKSRTMIEDRLYGIISTDHIERGDAAWWDWRIWVYTPDDPVLGMKRSSHSDARGEQPKYGMVFT